MRIALSLIASSVFLLSCNLVLAHSVGVSIEREVGEYTVDIGYDPSEPQNGDRMILDFDLSKGGSPVQFDKAWVRIFSDDATFLATGIAHADIGATTLLYRIPNVRELSINTRFEKDGNVLAATEFSLAIELVPESRQLRYSIIFGCVLLFLATSLLFAKWIRARLIRPRYPHTIL